MKQHRSLLMACSLIVLSFALAGCGQKTAQNATGSAASDSLLASSPVEQPQGQLQPQPGGTTEQAAPAPVTQGGVPVPRPRHTSSSPARQPSHTVAVGPSAVVAAGSNLGITVGTAVTSETASEGSAWSGTVTNAFSVGSSIVFPAGSTVGGVVAGVKPAAKGDRAFLLLRVTSITANGVMHDISATSDSMNAGSTRKRNVGAVALGAGAGALLGSAMGHSGKSAVIGGLLGGAAAAGAVATTKGFQVEVPAGKEIVFHVDHDVRIRL